MSSQIAQLCADYDRAQAMTRDPKRVGLMSEHLKALESSRVAIEERVRYLMQIADEHPQSISPLRQLEDAMKITAELVYFNSWFNLRGGWIG